MRVIRRVAMLIIAPLPAPFPSVATRRERVPARPSKPRSQVVTWMSVHMPMQRTYEGLAKGYQQSRHTHPCTLRLSGI